MSRRVQVVFYIDEDVEENDFIKELDESFFYNWDSYEWSEDE